MTYLGIIRPVLSVSMTDGSVGLVSPEEYITMKTPYIDTHYSDTVIYGHVIWMYYLHEDVGAVISSSLQSELHILWRVCYLNMFVFFISEL